MSRPVSSVISVTAAVVAVLAGLSGTRPALADPRDPVVLRDCVTHGWPGLPALTVQVCEADRDGTVRAWARLHNDGPAPVRWWAGADLQFGLLPAPGPLPHLADGVLGGGRAVVVRGEPEVFTGPTPINMHRARVDLAVQVERQDGSVYASFLSA